MVKESMIKNLKERGWTNEDINKAFKIIQSSDKSDVRPFMNKVVYWTALVITVVGNILISVVLVLFLLTLNKLPLYIIIATVALVFGLLFNLILNDIENIDPRHRIIAGVFIPAIALINIYIIAVLTNEMQIALAIENPHSPALVSVIYAIAFATPYVISSYRKK